MNKLETGGDEEALSSAHQVKVGEMVVKILIWWYCHQDFDFMVVNILIWWCLPPGESESGWDGGFWCDDIRHQDFDLMVVKILILWWSRFWLDDIQEKGENLEKCDAKKAAAVGKGVSSLSEKVFP